MDVHGYIYCIHITSTVVFLVRIANPHILPRQAGCCGCGVGHISEKHAATQTSLYCVGIVRHVSVCAGGLCLCIDTNVTTKYVIKFTFTTSFLSERSEASFPELFTTNTLESYCSTWAAVRQTVWSLQLPQCCPLAAQW